MALRLQKFTGWVLLLVGVAIIFWSLSSSYNIFTAKTKAPEIFKIEKKETVLPQKEPRNLQAQMEEMISKQLKGLIPIQTLPTLLNLISWSIFAGILIFAGAQLAHIGIKLLK
ncbi:MAG: hypothetical protein QME61_02460 [Patescibacteria group bacterium]|nr:hypothetical protein [Patescibacteria group bacterium]